MTNKIKLCWKWVGDPLFKRQWLEACANVLAEHFEVFCEESEREELAEAGLAPTSPGEDWGGGSQYLLLAMLASGEAEAAIWVDDRAGADNASMQALSLARARLIPIGMEPSGAAAIVSALARADAPSSYEAREHSVWIEDADSGGDCEPLDETAHESLAQQPDSRETQTRVQGAEAEIDLPDDSDDSEFADIEWFAEESDVALVSEPHNSGAELKSELMDSADSAPQDSTPSEVAPVEQSLPVGLDREVGAPALPIRVVRALAAKALRKSTARSGKKTTKSRPQFGAKKKNDKV